MKIIGVKLCCITYLCLPLRSFHGKRFKVNVNLYREVVDS